MKALSIRAPWWWFILYNGKDMENRRWRTHHRGPLLIHASKWWHEREIRADLEACGIRLSTQQLASMQQLGGHLVGRVEITACLRKSDSPWFYGPFGFVLANATPSKAPTPIRGRQGLFEVPERLLHSGTEP